MIYRQDGKKWTLPDVLLFMDADSSIYVRRFRPRHFYTVEYRRPKTGEWFLSGAVIEPYRALFDFRTKYLVATPTDEAIKVTEWRKKP